MVTPVIISPFQSMFCHPKSAPAQHFYHVLDQFWNTKDPWPTDPLPRVSMPRPRISGQKNRVRGVRGENALLVSLSLIYVSLSPKKNTKRSQTNCEIMQLPKFPPFTHTSSTQWSMPTKKNFKLKIDIQIHPSKSLENPNLTWTCIPRPSSCCTTGSWPWPTA